MKDKNKRVLYLKVRVSQEEMGLLNANIKTAV